MIMKEKNVSISGSLMQKENPEQISTMSIEVEFIENYTDKANELGSKVVKNKQEIARGLLCSFKRYSRKHFWCLEE
jgi:predicted enzyme related to lactoylglutathione lyase